MECELLKFNPEFDPPECKLPIRTTILTMEQACDAGLLEKKTTKKGRVKYVIKPDVIRPFDIVSDSEGDNQIQYEKEII